MFLAGEGGRAGADVREGVSANQSQRVPAPAPIHSPVPLPMPTHSLPSPLTRKQPSYEGFVVVRRLPAASPLKEDESEEAGGDEASREEEERAPVIMWKSPAQGTVVPCCTVTV